MGRTYAPEELARRVFVIVMAGVGLEIAVMALIPSL